MNRIQSLWACGLLVAAMSTGCRNCCPANGFVNSPTIASPPTYSLQIPSAHGATPYYVPGASNAGGPASTATLPPHLVDPNRRAPTAGGQNGWRPINGNNLSGTNSAPPAPVQASSTIFAASSATSAAEVARAPQSVLDSVNYASTRTDERLDSTRLPATDASNVRAPAGFVNNASANRLARVQQSPGYPTTYNRTAAYTRPAPTVYQGTPIIAGGLNPAGSVYYGTPFATQSPPAVLAQSTTALPAGTSQGTSGWRDREITASRGALNR